MAPQSPASTSTSTPLQSTPPQNDEEEDDYLSMTFTDPSSTTTTRKETLTQARKRKLLQSETLGRPKSKAELAAEEASRREAALSTSRLEPTNKGFKMMAALGYKPGSALGTGRDANARIEPIQLSMKDDRSGIGRESEAKRKFREEAEIRMEGEKKRKVEEGDFVERVRAERETQRTEGQVVGAQKVAERLEEEEVLEEVRKKRKLRSVNVLWRGLVKQREVAERDRRMRHDLYMSLSRKPEYDDPDEENDDQIALGKGADLIEVDDEELDGEDEELDEFDGSEPKEKLDRLVRLLRERWRYCFWCKYGYEDEAMEGCPGLTEDDHD